MAEASMLKVETRPIEKVTPYAKNPKRIGQRAVAKVAASPKEFGWRQPIVVDKAGVIIVGHARLLAAQSLGMTEVPVHVAANLTPAQVKAYRLADNRVSEEAAWDDAMLFQEIADLAKLDFDLNLTGFEPNEITGKPGTAKDEPITVKAVETGLVADKFWISVRGPLTSQAEAFQALREVMSKIPGIEVEQGTTAVEGEQDEWADFRKS